MLLLASPILFSSKSLDLYKHYELPTGANPLVGEHHLHEFAFFQRDAFYMRLQLLAMSSRMRYVN